MVSKTKAKGNTNPVDNLLAWGFYMIRDKIIAACSAGQAFTLDGFGTWVPCPQPDGSVEIQFRPDVSLINALNDPYTVSKYSEYCDKSAAELVELWNKEHPEDPVPSWITVLDPE